MMGVRKRSDYGPEYGQIMVRNIVPIMASMIDRILVRMIIMEMVRMRGMKKVMIMEDFDYCEVQEKLNCYLSYLT